MDGRRKSTRPQFCDFWLFQTYFYNNLFNPDKNSKIQKAA